jgi:16S rRNA (guanine527-N7)-methyltransferase
LTGSDRTAEVTAGRLVRDASALGVRLSAEEASRLLQLRDELTRWNQRFNLTAITDPEAMVTHHLLDSLAIGPDLAGTHVADVGTGAGFPGVPLAVAYPALHFTLVDSVAKKLRFVSHAVQLLQLTNVSVAHARVETMAVPASFDTVVARAFAPLPKLLGAVERLCGPQTQVLAMKGKWPQAELEAVPSGWRVVRSRKLAVPGLDAERCVISLQRA